MMSHHLLRKYILLSPCLVCEDQSKVFTRSSGYEKSVGTKKEISRTRSANINILKGITIIGGRNNFDGIVGKGMMEYWKVGRRIIDYFHYSNIPVSFERLSLPTL